MSDELWNWSKYLPLWPPSMTDYYRRPGLPAQEETSPKPEDKTKKNYRLVRTSGYWQLWLSLKSGDQKWLTDREVSGESGKTFAEAFYDADLKFIPGGV